jgi:hypothetical protein
METVLKSRNQEWLAGCLFNYHEINTVRALFPETGAHPWVIDGNMLGWVVYKIQKSDKSISLKDCIVHRNDVFNH